MTIDEAVECNRQLRLFMIAEDASNDTNRFSEESYKALDMAIEALEHTRWIPVSERLPRYDKYVLMFYSQDKLEIGYYHYDSTFYPAEYADLNETGWYTKEGDITDEPIAWMYLPKPYTAESEECK